MVLIKSYSKNTLCFPIDYHTFTMQNMSSVCYIFSLHHLCSCLHFYIYCTMSCWLTRFALMQLWQLLLLCSITCSTSWECCSSLADVKISELNLTACWMQSFSRLIAYTLAKDLWYAGSFDHNELQHLYNTPRRRVSSSIKSVSVVD